MCRLQHHTALYISCYHGKSLVNLFSLIRYSTSDPTTACYLETEHKQFKIQFCKVEKIVKKKGFAPNLHIILKTLYFDF